MVSDEKEEEEEEEFTAEVAEMPQRSRRRKNRTLKGAGCGTHWLFFRLLQLRE